MTACRTGAFNVPGLLPGIFESLPVFAPANTGIGAFHAMWDNFPEAARVHSLSGAVRQILRILDTHRGPSGAGHPFRRDAFRHEEK